ERDAGRVDRLVRKAGAVVGTELDCLTTVTERRTLSRLLTTILDNVHHPLHSTLNRQKSIFSGRLLSLSCSSDRLRKSFVPRAIQLYNVTQKGRGREMDFLLKKVLVYFIMNVLAKRLVQNVVCKVCRLILEKHLVSQECETRCLT